MSKYRPRFAKQLLKGLRKDGSSVEEVCTLWNITRTTYYNWVKTIPAFAHAHEIGEQDKTAWWRKLQRDVASGVSAGNAACINLALKNEAGYVDKVEHEHTHNEQITTIRIERIESPKLMISEGIVIEQED